MTESEGRGGWPTGVVTFLFTDVEGSTRMWQQDPDAMRDLLAHHDVALHDACERHGGYIFTTAGDSFAVAFTQPSEAVAAAIEAQRAVAETTGGRLRVRMGLHIGEASERNGDYFGVCVNVTARLMAAAHGGQVLLSDELRRMLGPIATRDLGPHDLKDIEEAVHVHQLIVDGLEERFPPLRSVRRGRPPPKIAGPFVGRMEDIENVARLLAEERLVTIVGPGGVGKTRLAVEVADRLLPTFPAGVWYADLLAAHDAGGVAEEIARATGVDVEGGDDIVDALAKTLVTRAGLLILDNAEHVIGAVVEVVDRLLAIVERPRILVTSREPTALTAEVLHRLAPLDTDPAGSAAELLRVLVERRGGSLDEGSPLLPDVLARLGGLPLALELAAAKIAVLGLEPMVELATRLDRLGSRRGSGPSHHRTLQATIAWSYDLLEPGEQEAFLALAYFDAAFTPSTAAAILGIELADAWEVVEALSERSLLVRSPELSSPRLRMLVPLREFARARWVPGQAARLARRHLRSVVGSYRDPEDRREEFTRSERLLAELPDVRRSFESAIGGGDPAGLAVALDAFAATAQLWDHPRLLADGARLGASLVRSAAAMLGPDTVIPIVDPVARLVRAMSGHDDALRLLEQLEPETLDAEGRAVVELARASVHLDRFEAEEGRRHLETAQMLLPAGVPSWIRALLLRVDAMAGYWTQDLDRQARAMEQMRRLAAEAEPSTAYRVRRAIAGVGSASDLQRHRYRLSRTALEEARARLEATDPEDLAEREGALWAVGMGHLSRLEGARAWSAFEELWSIVSEDRTGEALVRYHTYRLCAARLVGHADLIGREGPMLRKFAAEAGMTPYEATTAANLAWARWTAGADPSDVARDARSALESMDRFAGFPFRWPAVSLLVATAADPDEARTWAAELVAPWAQRMPTPIEESARELLDGGSPERLLEDLRTIGVI